jgi:hypothetical protein
MPGYVLQQGATVLCVHGGQAQPTAPSPRVRAGGQPITTLPAPWVVAGCSFLPPPPGPCVSAQWVVSATRVRSGGFPVLIADGVAVCAPTGTGVNVVVTQVRVKAT